MTDPTGDRYGSGRQWKVVVVVRIRPAPVSEVVWSTLGSLLLAELVVCSGALVGSFLSSGRNTSWSAASSPVTVACSGAQRTNQDTTIPFYADGSDTSDRSVVGRAALHRKEGGFKLCTNEGVKNGWDGGVRRYRTQFVPITLQFL